ncbi:hypothetical protein OIU78_004800 [Salix suchowensis]|nr:hypothetical protein OIU78_004800 [Salix suchowensis]
MVNLPQDNNRFEKYHELNDRNKFTRSQTSFKCMVWPNESAFKLRFLNKKRRGTEAPICTLTVKMVMKDNREMIPTIQVLKYLRPKKIFSLMETWSYW